MRTALAVLGLATLLACGACGEEKISRSDNSAPPPSRAMPSGSSSAGPPTVTRTTEYTENDFVESDHNRDPFRSYITLGQPTGPRPATNQREVKLAQYTIDELKLVAIVLGGDGARALFVDPTGKGTVIMRGAFICRPEVVHLGGTNGPEYQLNWRVDRIRDGDVVLIREDPSNPAIPPATRIVPLHPEAEKEKGKPG